TSSLASLRASPGVIVVERRSSRSDSSAATQRTTPDGHAYRRGHRRNHQHAPARHRAFRYYGPLWLGAVPSSVPGHPPRHSLGHWRPLARQRGAGKDPLDSLGAPLLPEERFREADTFSGLRERRSIGST